MIEITGMRRVTAMTGITWINRITRVSGMTIVTRMTRVDLDGGMFGMTGMTRKTRMTGVTRMTRITRVNKMTGVNGITGMTIACEHSCLSSLPTARDVSQERSQRAKKVVSDSPGLVDFAIGLVNSIVNLPDGQVRFFEQFE